MDGEIKKLVANPQLGVEKKQDLKGIFVHKFFIQKLLYLLAYAFNLRTLTLVILGVHENFYRNLRK